MVEKKIVCIWWEAENSKAGIIILFVLVASSRHKGVFLGFSKRWKGRFRDFDLRSDSDNESNFDLCRGKDRS